MATERERAEQARDVLRELLTAIEGYLVMVKGETGSDLREGNCDGERLDTALTRAHEYFAVPVLSSPAPVAPPEPLCRCEPGVCLLHPSLTTCGMRSPQPATASAPPDALRELVEKWKVFGDTFQKLSDQFTLPAAKDSNGMLAALSRHVVDDLTALSAPSAGWQDIGTAPKDGKDVVGHKTIATGRVTEQGFPELRHEPLTRAEATLLLEESDRAKAKRAEMMPGDQDAIEVLFAAWLRLKELGWNDAIYCPKDGSTFDAIEAGSTGIHECSYDGKWPDGHWWLHADGDLCPSRPILFKPNAIPAPPAGPATGGNK